jgi:O-antigen/teichoic acid export membrane protein
VDRAGPRRLRLRAVARSAVAVTGLFLFSTVDLLLARHHLRGVESGGYVAAATVAKTVLALPAAVMSAILPRLVAAWPDRGRAGALAAGTAAVAGPALVGAAVLVAVPGPLVRLLYGNGYAATASLVAALAAIAGMTSIVTVLTYAGLARRAASIAVPWVGTLIEVALIEMRHGTPVDIATASAAALAPTLLLIVFVEVRAWRRGPARTAQFTPPGADHSGRSAGVAPAR